MIRAVQRACAATVLALGIGLPAWAETTLVLQSFDALDGWQRDDHDAALSVFVESCDRLDGAVWEPICAAARSQTERAQGARAFFEALFRPVVIGAGETALFTGYYEPELSGATRPGGRFRYPLYRLPPELGGGGPWATRREIEERGLLRGRGLEIAWVDDPVEAFFLHIQGSGRVRLPDGRVIRVGYAGKNGHPYRSVGQELIRRGTFQPHQVSAGTIQDWVRRNPAAGRALLWHNPSYVFFREINEVPPEKGPIGAMSRSITAHRSIAVDPAFVPLGAPVWIEKDGRDPIRRLTVAQDTGGAIKGAQRADIFFGTGDDAGRAAGRIRDPGRLVVLLPIPLAYALAPES